MLQIACSYNGLTASTAAGYVLLSKTSQSSTSLIHITKQSLLLSKQLMYKMVSTLLHTHTVQIITEMAIGPEGGYNHQAQLSYITLVTHPSTCFCTHIVRQVIDTGVSGIRLYRKGIIDVFYILPTFLILIQLKQPFAILFACRARQDPLSCLCWVVKF